MRNAAFTQALAAATHRPAFLHMPAAILRTLMGEMSDLLLASQRVVPARALKSGYRFRFNTLTEALHDLVD